MKKTLSLLGFALLASACGNKDVKQAASSLSAAASGAVTQAQMTGSWKTQCAELNPIQKTGTALAGAVGAAVSELKGADLSSNALTSIKSVQYSFEFGSNGSDVRKKTTYFGDNCTQALYVEEEKGTLDKPAADQGKPANSVNIDVKEVSLTPMTDDTAKELQSVNALDGSNWVKGQARVVTNKVCLATACVVGNKVPYTLFDVATIVNSRLVIGNDFLAIDEKNRPTQPDTGHPLDSVPSI